MELIRGDSLAARELARAIPAPCRFTLVDIGCSGGLDDGWRVFGDRLTAFGFDPNLTEVARLQRIEKSATVHYVPGFVGFGDGVDPKWQAPREPKGERLSYQRSQRRRAETGADPHTDIASKTMSNDWSKTPLADPDKPILIPEYLASASAPPVDFIKIDCDGPDFEILKGLTNVMNSAPVLGAMLEVNFIGTGGEDENSFHNTDRFMRRLGFRLFGLTVRNYSSATLPFPYRPPHPYLGQTMGGRPYQGDALYVRDWAGEGRLDLPLETLIKLAAIFALFGLPDHAAEVLVAQREALQQVIDVPALLEMLTTQIQDQVAHIYGRQTRSHDEYQAAFDAEEPNLFGGGGLEWRRLYGVPAPSDELQRAKVAISLLRQQLSAAEALIAATPPPKRGLFR